MANFPLSTVLLVNVLLVAGSMAVSELEEERLLDYLHSKASHALARPVKRVQDAVEVKFGLSVQHLELDEKAETLYGNHWMNYDWQSPYLTWNPANFSDIRSVRIPMSYIWNPDISVYNSKEENPHSETKAVVHSDGTVNYVPRVRTASMCQMDLTYFPFDKQTCEIRIGSWSYNGNKLNVTLRSDKVDLSNYTPNRAWSLTDSNATRVVRTYTYSNNNKVSYITLRFYFTLARQSTYFTYVYVGPVFILSILGGAIFILPPGNTQKMTIGGALLICYGLFFLDVSYIMPPIHASTPLIDKFYMALYVMLAISICLAAIVTNLAKRSWTHSDPPEIVKTVILSWLGRVFCVSASNSENFGTGKEDASGVKAETNSSHPSQTHQTVEWYLIATVMDRLFLTLYVVLIVLLSFSILISYPK